MPNTSPRDFTQTVQDIELDLDHMHLLFSYLSVPTLLYDNHDNISWCNRSMLNLFWGAGTDEPVFRHQRNYFGKNIFEVMPEHLAKYIQKQNAIVQKTRKSQYETWKDETLQGTIEWNVLRFPAGEHHIGVVLFPKDEKYLEKCDLALSIKG